MVREDVKRFVEDNLRVLSMMKLPEGRKKHAKWMRQQIDNKARSIESQLKDKKVTLVRQYRGHDAEIEREIRDLEETLRYMRNTKIKDAKMDYKKFIDSVVGNIARKIEDEFNEKDHPRDKGGKFTSKGDEGKGGSRRQEAGFYGGEKVEQEDPKRGDELNKYAVKLEKAGVDPKEIHRLNREGDLEGMKKLLPETETEKAAKEEIGESSKSSDKTLVKNLKEVASEGFYHYPNMIEGFLKDMGVKMPKLSSEEQEYFEENPDEYRDLLMDKVNAAIERDPEKAHEALGEWASDISEEDEEVKAGKETDAIVEEFKGSGIDMYAALADLGIDVQRTPEAYHEDVFKEKLFNSPKFRQKAKEYIKQYRGTEDEEEWFK